MPNFQQQYQPQYQNPYSPYMRTQYEPAYVPYGSMQMPQQSVQQMPQTMNISGRFVDDENNITANEVPMTGEMAIFPMRNMEAIIAKRWNADGSISTLKYEPIKGNPTNTAQGTVGVQESAFNEFVEGVSNRLNELSAKIDKIDKKLASQRSRKDVDES